MKKKFNSINLEINMPERTMRRISSYKKRRISPIDNFRLNDPIDNINLDEIDLEDMAKLSDLINERIGKYIEIKGMIDDTRYMYS